MRRTNVAASGGVSRRSFLQLSAIVGAGTLAAACTGQRPPLEPITAPTQPPAPAAGAPAQVPGQRYQEAPQLAELVKQGRLPAVDERLPKTPLVVEPVERVGKYGGQWRTALLGGQDGAWLVRTVDYENLVRWDIEWKKVIPNVAESFEANQDGTVYTFRLREGLKWSDGQSFTADDLVFWFEDVASNTDLSPGGVPDWMEAGGKPGVLEKVDLYTVRFKFEYPNGLILERLATPASFPELDPTRFPRHYLQQFHRKYNPNVDQLAREQNAEDWVKLFRLKGAGIPGTPYDARWQNKDLPTLHGWVVTTPYGQGTQVVAERNPYYFKVDTEGNQLPYLDRIVYDVLQDKEVLVLRATNGDIDMMDRHIATPQNKPVFIDNQQRGQYHFYETIPSSMNDVIIALNLNHKDPIKREIFQNKDFRIGLSHAINRQEIIDVVWVGQGEPHQAAPRPESPFYHERLARQYTEHDIQKANEHLDRAGYSRRDGEGFRLGPDGQRISFAIEVTSALGIDRVDVLNLVVDHWRQVGIDAQVKEEDRSLLYTRKEANEHDAVVWAGDGGLDVILEPRWYFPYSNESNFAQAWRTWYNPMANPRTAPEEPPEAPRKQMELYDQLKATADEKKKADLMKQILDIAAEQFYVIGISLPPKSYGIVKNNFHNVPKTMPNAWLYPHPAPTNPSQYFVD